MPTAIPAPPPLLASRRLNRLEPVPSEPVDCERPDSGPGDVDAALSRRLDEAVPDVLAWCRRLGGPKVDAEDAAQDVLLTAFTRLDSLRDPSCFHAWLYGITRRVLASHRRRAWVRRWVPGAPAEALDRGPDPCTSAQFSELSCEVQSILEKLPVHQREVLVLRDVEGRSDSEVAELLGIPVGTVKSRSRLARQRFRRFARNYADFIPRLTAAPSWGQG